MKRKFCLLILLVCFALLFRANSGRAEESSDTGKLRALLIGCDYFVSQESTWPAAENNLKMLSDTLLSDARDYALVRSLSGSLSSVSDFEEAVLNAFGSSDKNDTSLLYISTHGVFEEGVTNASAALLLSDGEREARLDAVTLERILDQIPGKKVVILDACNSGAMIGKGLSGGATRSFLTGEDYRVLCSAGGSEASWYYQAGENASLSGASYFATVLTQGLSADGGHAADQNADGIITLTEIYSYLCDNYAASTPQVYPQEEDGEAFFAYDPDAFAPVRKIVTDISFDETLLTAGETEVSFSFTVHRQTTLYYQIVYHRDGVWQFTQAQHFSDSEQVDGTVLPGRKMRTLALNTGDDAYGYALIQLLTIEDGQPVFQGARLLCVQPALGGIQLRVLTGAAFLPAMGQEMAILVQHDVPCGLTVAIRNEDGKIVRRLAYEAPSRPQQLSPTASSFYWDGKLSSGEFAPPGQYTVEASAWLNGQEYRSESEPFSLE